MVPISRAVPEPVRPGGTLPRRSRWSDRVGIAALCLMLGACAPEENPKLPQETSTGDTAPAPAADRAPAAATTATHVVADPAGPLVLARVDNGFRRIPIPLGSDFGFLVMNEGDEEHLSALVSVGFRRDSRVITCRSIPEFEAALRHIPAGSTVHRHDRCLRPASTGLPEDFLAGIERTLVRSGLTVAPDTVTTCLCGR